MDSLIKILVFSASLMVLVSVFSLVLPLLKVRRSRIDYKEKLVLLDIGGQEICFSSGNITAEQRYRLIKALLALVENNELSSYSEKSEEVVTSYPSQEGR
jgi:hypothetical protein